MDCGLQPQSEGSGAAAWKASRLGRLQSRRMATETVAATTKGIARKRAFHKSKRIAAGSAPAKAISIAASAAPTDKSERHAACVAVNCLDQSAKLIADVAVNCLDQAGRDLDCVGAALAAMLLLLPQTSAGNCRGQARSHNRRPAWHFAAALWVATTATPVAAAPATTSPSSACLHAHRAMRRSCDGTDQAGLDQFPSGRGGRSEHRCQAQVYRCGLLMPDQNAVSQ